MNSARNQFILDLDSSMNSAQGLLSFMTDASKQIKTYLDDGEPKPKVCEIISFLFHISFP